jgi:hypothetical protein
MQERHAFARFASSRRRRLPLDDQHLSRHPFCLPPSSIHRDPLRTYVTSPPTDLSPLRDLFCLNDVTAQDPHPPGLSLSPFESPIPASAPPPSSFSPNTTTSLSSCPPSKRPPHKGNPSRALLPLPRLSSLSRLGSIISCKRSVRGASERSNVSSLLPARVFGQGGREWIKDWTGRTVRMGCWWG